MNPPGEDPEGHGERQREPALRRVEDRGRVVPVVAEVVEDVAEPAADDRARDGADEDEHEVVEPEAGRRHVRPDRRRDDGHPGGEDQAEEQDDREGDRLEADGRGVAELDDRVEGERDDPERHGASVVRRPSGRGSLATSSSTAAADLSNAARSSAVRVISMTRCSPPAPRTTGTPTNRPSTPYSPCEVRRRTAGRAAGRAGSRRPSRTSTRRARRTPIPS